MFARICSLAAVFVLLATQAMAGENGISQKSGVSSSGLQHAICISGTPALGEDFDHLPYVNPDAPKGGTFRLSAVGTFDSFHPFIARGIPAAGSGLLIASLTASSLDEPFTQYPYVAESFEVAADKSFVIFHLNRAAKFSDGHPVTADDVVFTFHALLEKGSPTYSKYYEGIEKVEKLSRHSVKFSFREKNNPELPFVAGQMKVLPAHWWDGRDFSEPTLEVAPGCGPYRLKSSRTGYSVEYERIDDWWGRDLPVNKGRYNFDVVRYDYYRDRTVSAEAFRSGAFDFCRENSAKAWAQDYTGPAIEAGLIKCKALEHSRPAGMQGFIFNTRRGIFADRRVRQALGLAFDFEWTNKALFYGQYKRCNSYFTNSIFAADGPLTPEEEALLSPWKDSVPQDVFNDAPIEEKTDGTGRIRGRLRKALTLLREAGWRLEDGVLRNEDGKPFEFEMLLRSPSMERVVLPYSKNLSRLGITMHVTMADSSRYIRRIRSYDFDMIVSVIRQSDSPGNEQRFFWTSSAAETPGTRNLAGVKNPVVDALVEDIIAAENRDRLKVCVRALDRVLRAEYYVVPGWYSPVDRVAYWCAFDMPESRPSRGIDIFSWWYDEAGAERIAEAGFAGGAAR